MFMRNHLGVIHHHWMVTNGEMTVMHLSSWWRVYDS